jgi:hypothetical protein
MEELARQFRFQILHTVIRTKHPTLTITPLLMIRTKRNPAKLTNI